MRSNGFDGMTCPVAAVMGAIGDRWGLLVMRDLLLGITRYEDLRRSAGVTNATLSDRLKALERDGLIERRPYRDRPVRHEYGPTARGREIGLLMQAMVQIGDRWKLFEPGGPPLRFVDERSGRDVELRPIDVETGEPVAGRHVRPRAGRGADAIMQWRLRPATADDVRQSQPGSARSPS